MRSKKYWLLASILLVALLGPLVTGGRFRFSAAVPTRSDSTVTSAARVDLGSSAKAAPPATKVAKATTVPANGEHTNELFAYVPRPADAAGWEAKLFTPAKEIFYVRLNQEVATGKQSPFWKTGNGGRLDIVLPDGSAIPVVMDRTQQHGAQQFVSEGRIEGDAYGRAIFAYKDGEMSALVEDIQHGSWQLRAIAGGVAQWFKVDASQIGPCGATQTPNDPQKRSLIARQAASAQVAADQSPTVDQPVAAADTIKPEVRILMLYTDAVANSVSAPSIATQMDLAIGILNSDWARSQISATATLAGTARVAYADDDIATDGTNNQSDALTRLAMTNDGYMDSIHALRDQVSADLVCLTLHRKDKNSAGIAYIMDTPGDVNNPTQGFSVVEFAVMNLQNIFSHEIGHNLGCAHDRENAKDSNGNPSAGAYSYSYGYRFTGADGVQYRTIMSYTPGQRISYFSNPDITAPAPISRPVGVPVGQTGEADNARTIRQDVFEVSNYRLSTQAPANVGTLVNVSTRAYVSTGAQQLIGGFIVSGSQPKKILIRAIGPTLSQYGITDALADPTMKLVRLSDGVTVDQNDNWGTGPNAAAVAAAMTTVNAFALPAGSRDSAITATLTAGGYTANIEGVGGTSGTALVEAYEVDQTGSRLANLSTRAYADTTHPMIGGFIIKGDPANPGKTKRVVVRVLGPSLANYGVTGALDDPIVELHDSTSLLLINDDWSSGSTGGDDTKPYVRIYEEQQIAAVGLAPGNRRDCAVMVDLVPGLYTAVVKPFEKLPTQVQKPGIGLVEVFEITP